MKTTLEITVKNCGNAVGTMGWFNSILNDSEIIIKKCKNGEPGLFLHEKHKKDGTETKENEGNTWICGIVDSHPSQYKLMYDKYACLYAYNDGYLQAGFSDFVLTPACKKAIDEFIDDCMTKFIEWFEVQ